MTQTVLEKTTQKYRWILVVWTLAVWGSRVRNILVDDELEGFDRFVSLGIALTLLVAAILVALALRSSASWTRPALGVLVLVGIARWTIRGPIIVLSDEWEVGFKVVHTVLWLVTVLLSVLAWREHQASKAQ